MPQFVYKRGTGKVFITRSRRSGGMAEPAIIPNLFSKISSLNCIKRLGGENAYFKVDRSVFEKFAAVISSINIVVTPYMPVHRYFSMHSTAAVALNISEGKTTAEPDQALVHMPMMRPKL